MAVLTQCDKCKTLDDVVGKIAITRRRTFQNQHDGVFTKLTIEEYDVCEKCAEEIEALLTDPKKMNKIEFA